MAGPGERASTSSTQKHQEPSNCEPVDYDQPQLSGAETKTQLEDGGYDQTSQPSISESERYAYSALMKRKNYYKEEAYNYSRLIEELNLQNIGLQLRLESCQQQVTHLSRQGAGATDLEKENLLLKSQLVIVEEFAKTFNVKDFSQIQKEWLKDKDDLKQTREQLSKLQDEVLACVERFDPSFDSQVLQGFVRLNNTIGKLTKSKEFRKMVLRGNPLTDWDAHALWEDSFNPSIKADGPSDMEKRLLLRQAIWKFISERLLDRGHPLACFGGAVGELASRLCFDKLFPDHEVNESAGTWRSITMRRLCLQEAENGNRDKKEILKELLAEFTAYMQEKLGMGTMQQEQLDSILTKGGLNKKLEEVFERAVGFSRLIMQERAAFTIRSPHLSEMKFTRGEDDESTTAQGVVLGVNDGHDIEVDLVGAIKLVGSPMLKKHGDGGGKNLDHSMVVVRAFVLIDP